MSIECIRDWHTSSEDDYDIKPGDKCSPTIGDWPFPTYAEVKYEVGVATSYIIPDHYDLPSHEQELTDLLRECLPMVPTFMRVKILTAIGEAP